MGIGGKAGRGAMLCVLMDWDTDDADVTDGFGFLNPTRYNRAGASCRRRRLVH